MRTTDIPYELWSPDVWGNPEDGWDVNDRAKLTTLTLTDPKEDRTVLQDLIREGYLAPIALTHCEIDDHYWPTIWIIKADDQKPLYELVCLEEDYE